MRKIAIIQCGKQKLNKNNIEAYKLYTGDLFKKSLGDCLNNEKIDLEDIYVLSAFYNLIPCKTLINYYNLSVKDLTKEQKLIKDKTINDMLNKIIDNEEYKLYLYVSNNYLNTFRSLKNFDYLKMWPDKGLGYIKHYLKEKEKLYKNDK